MTDKTQLPLQVLIVDDDEMTRFIHNRVLSECGFKDVLFTFNTAEQCIEHLGDGKAQIPTLIYLDINMPLMNGWDFLERLNKGGMCINIKIIMTTSSVDYEDRHRAKDYKCIIDYVEKPLSVAKCRDICTNEHLAPFANFIGSISN